MTDFILRSRRVLLPRSDRPVPATIYAKDGVIVKVERDEESTSAVDLGNAIIMPGIIDTHAHINEPGRTEWEGFQTATRAAAAGGITTVIDMPLNSIPATTTLEALRAKAAAAEGHCSIDYGFWGGVVPGNARELEPMIRAGAFGFKCFLCPSGVDEFPMVTERDLHEAMPILARAGVPLLVHAELESAVHASGDPRAYSTYLRSRPQKWEVDAIGMVIRLARDTGCRAHIVHLSASDALPELREARAQGIPITAETCPHYLSLDAESIPAGATQFKCAPPIRENSNREKLWKAIEHGEIEFVVSDHSPCTPKLKCLEAGDFSKAWGGIAGLQFSLPVVWTEMRARGLTLADLTRLMSAHTARFLALGTRKGAIAAGHDADLVVFDPDETFTLDPARIEHRHKITPYAGRKLHGVVHQTYVRGHKVYDQGKFADRPLGRRLERKHA